MYLSYLLLYYLKMTHLSYVNTIKLEQTGNYISELFEFASCYLVIHM